MNKIPAGWKQVKLGEITQKIGSGITPRGGSSVYSDEGIMFLRSQNIQNGKFNLSDVKYISPEIDESMKSSRVKKDDVLYNITGASIGRSAVYLFEANSNVNQHVCIIRLKNVNPKFINSFLLSKQGVRELYSFQAGGNREGLNFQQLSSFKLLLPPLLEQEKIVEVLETWDSYIEGLNKAINLKRKVRNGLIHKLLTGQIRLAGFADPWEVVLVSDICEIKKGSGLSKEKLSKNGKNKCILYGEIYTTYDKFIFNIISKTDVNEGIKSKKDDVLIPASTTTSALDLATATTLLEDDVLIGGDVNILRKKMPASFDGIFFAYYLSHVKKHELARLAQGITIVHLYGKDLKKIAIETPKIEEQRAIADVLVKGYQEIEALEKKKALVEDQKKFLLNNLITGKIRLPEFIKKDPR